MSESSIVPYVKTTPKPFGVSVEWKWPGGCAVLELQYLREDSRLVKERIHWPTTGHLISGLKAGERLQVRLRPVAADGSTRDWLAADWIDGVSSVDTEEILHALDEEIRNYSPIEGLKWGWFVDKAGQAYIHKALIGDGILSTNYSVKMNIRNDGKEHAAGMTVGVEDGQRKVVFESDRRSMKPHPFTLDKAMVTNMKMKTVLSDEMKLAVIDTVRESDLLTALQTNIDAQTASITGLQQAMSGMVNDALCNAMRPGSAIWLALARR